MNYSKDEIKNYIIDNFLKKMSDPYYIQPKVLLNYFSQYAKFTEDESFLFIKDLLKRVKNLKNENEKIIISDIYSEITTFISLFLRIMYNPNIKRDTLLFNKKFFINYREEYLILFSLSGERDKTYSFLFNNGFTNNDFLNYIEKYVLEIASNDIVYEFKKYFSFHKHTKYKFLDNNSIFKTLIFFQKMLDKTNIKYKNIIFILLYDFDENLLKIFNEFDRFQLKGIGLNEAFQYSLNINSTLKSYNFYEKYDHMSLKQLYTSLSKKGDIDSLVQIAARCNKTNIINTRVANCILLKYVDKISYENNVLESSVYTETIGLLLEKTNYIYPEIYNNKFYIREALTHILKNIKVPDSYWLNILKYSKHEKDIKAVLDNIYTIPEEYVLKYIDKLNRIMCFHYSNMYESVKTYFKLNGLL